jgi:putative FmdB family regulatory protein
VPTYQYACTQCGHQLEAVQSFSDEPLTICPACEGRLRKLFSSVGIVFKGSGFYRTDSRAGAGASGPNGSSESSSPATTSSESTPASTPKKDSAKPAAPAVSSGTAA